MLTRSLVLAVLAAAFFAAAGCGRSSGRSGGDPAARAGGGAAEARTELAAALERYTLGAPAVAANLAVVPLIAPEAGDGPAEEYLTLAEAMEKHLVAVTEEGGGSVPTLLVASRATSPVLVPFGAIVSGGKQDRMIAEDLVLLPGEKRKVSVFCVEQGRWHAGDAAPWIVCDGGDGELRQATAAISGHGAPAPEAREGAERVAARAHVNGAVRTSVVDVQGMAYEKNADYFVSNHAIAGNHVRGQAGRGQQGIWQNVGSQNVRYSNTSISANYQGNLETPEFKKLSKDYEPVRKAVAGLERCAGVVVLVGGKVRSCEAFASPECMGKLWPQMFASYVLDAGAEKDAPDAAAARASEAARRFLKLLEAAEVKAIEEKSSGGGRDELRMRRFAVSGGDVTGGAVIESAGGRLVYFRLFPKTEDEKQEAPAAPDTGEAGEAGDAGENSSPGHGPSGQNVLYIEGGRVHWVTPSGADGEDGGDSEDEPESAPRVIIQ